MNREREIRLTSGVLDKIRKTVPMNTGTRVMKDQTKEVRKDRKKWKQDLRRYEGSGRIAFVLGEPQCDRHESMYNRFKEMWDEQMNLAFARKLDIRFDMSGEEPRMRVVMYTDEKQYNISIVSTHSDLEDCYMGCTMTTRKSLPTEDHNRGRDFPDGDFTRETFMRIMFAILAEELLDLTDSVNLDKDGYKVGVE